MINRNIISELYRTENTLEYKKKYVFKCIFKYVFPLIYIIICGNESLSIFIHSVYKILSALRPRLVCFLPKKMAKT